MRETLATPAGMGLFGMVTILGSWAILASSKFWEGSAADSRQRRLIQTALGAAVGACAYWVQQTLLIDLDPQGHCGVGLAVPDEMFSITPGTRSTASRANRSSSWPAVSSGPIAVDAEGRFRFELCEGVAYSAFAFAGPMRNQMHSAPIEFTVTKTLQLEFLLDKTSEEFMKLRRLPKK